MGEHAALRWQKQESAEPELADAGEMEYYVALADVTQRLGAVNAPLIKRLRESCTRFSAVEYLGFDPRQEAPPGDLPELCKGCDTLSPRGTALCACGLALRPRSRYDVWSGALVSSYTADGFGAPMGAVYSDVLRWLPNMRPYRGYDRGSNPEFRDIAFAITHLVYTLNHYNRFRLHPEWLPAEFEFLTANALATQAAGDAELLGEFIDSLRAFGVPETDPSIRSAIDYLLATQRSDGSWGDDPDILRRCHTTWTAVDALRDFDWTETPAAVARTIALYSDPSKAR